MLNAIQFGQLWLEVFARQVARRGRIDTVLIGSIAGHSVMNIALWPRPLALLKPLSLVEVNASCPNTSDGRQFSADPSALGELIEQIRQVLGPKPMLVKLPPDMADPVGMCFWSTQVPAA